MSDHRNVTNWRDLIHCFNMADSRQRKDFYPFLLACILKQNRGVIEVSDQEMRETLANVRSPKPWPMNIIETPNGLRVELNQDL